jgi:N-alpha-acetyltransferase 30
MEPGLSQEVKLTAFSNEEELTWIAQVCRAELAEPYSVFTYYYFLKNWPELTVMAYVDNKPIGCIIGSIDKENPRKAYIAMLVVLKEYRRLKIGKQLFDDFVTRVKDRVDKIVLETECINKAALSFYLRLGFIKTRKMSNYYLSGNDAYRLKLYLRQRNPEKSEEET